MNGVNISRLPVKDAYAYGLALLDVFFTKEELRTSLMYQSSRSPKPALDDKRVTKLLHIVQKKFSPKEFDMGTLIKKINQKCRDCNIVRVKKETLFPPGGNPMHNKNPPEMMTMISMMRI